MSVLANMFDRVKPPLEDCSEDAALPPTTVVCRRFATAHRHLGVLYKGKVCARPFVETLPNSVCTGPYSSLTVRGLRRTNLSITQW